MTIEIMNVLRKEDKAISITDKQLAINRTIASFFLIFMIFALMLTD